MAFLGPNRSITSCQWRAGWNPVLQTLSATYPNSRLLSIDLPGIKAEDLDVSVVEGGLLIRGERKLATEDKQANYHRREREAGFFRRMIALPARVGAELSFDTPLEAPCSRCQGAGRVGHFMCGFCRGQGQERLEKKVTLSIPPGVRHGTVARIPLDDWKMGDLELVATVYVDAK